VTNPILRAGMFNKLVVLHVGCGPSPSAHFAELFPAALWHEIKLDVDSSARPDILASITDMGVVASGAVDAVYSSHNLEHLYAHEVGVALAEFRRVLKPVRESTAVVRVPDLQRVAALVAEGNLDGEAFVSEMGPISPIDVIYGHRAHIAQGNSFMAHKTGFTNRTLGEAMIKVGFNWVEVVRRGWDLLATARLME